ncbi:hypothetical protein [Hymenobacter arcticus]
MTPDLLTSVPTKAPSASVWLALGIVLTALLGAGRWTQQKAPAPTANSSAPVHSAAAARRVALAQPARPHRGAPAAFGLANL